MVHPLYFAQRVLYEMRPAEIVFNGEDPAKFLGQRDLLWPDTGDQGTQSQPTITEYAKSVECA
jgi:hypothetical protein